MFLTLAKFGRGRWKNICTKEINDDLIKKTSGKNPASSPSVSTRLNKTFSLPVVGNIHHSESSSGEQPTPK